jgi:hypothetical protein
MLRLARRAGGSNDGFGVSWGLFFATSCEEGDFPWDRSAAPAERLRQAREAFAAVPDSVYAPFPRDPVFHESLGGCARWPMTPTRPPLPTGPAPDVRTLVLAGAEDLRTPLENAQAVAADLPNAQLVEVPQAGHAVLETGCARHAMRAFARHQQPPPCRPGRDAAPTAPDPASLAELDPLGVPGRRGRTLRAVVATLGDMFDEARLSFLVGRFGGLRGGWFVALGPFARLHRLEYIPGVRVSGRLGIRGNTLRVSGPAAARGSLRVRGRHLVGRLGGRPIDVVVPRGSAERSPLRKRRAVPALLR